MQKIESFQSFYETALRPRFAALETERKQVADKLKLYGAIGFGVCFLLLFLKAGIFPFIITGVALYFFYQHHAKGFRSRYKHEVIRTMVSAEGLEYDAGRSIAQADYEKSKLFLQRINRYYGDDHVSGQVGKTNIRFSELFTQYESGSGKNKQLQTIFRGILFIADFNKKFIGETMVLPDVSENLMGSFGSFLQGLNFSRPQLVKLEDVEFEKQFVVYSTDQVEARYILSTALMQRILNFKTKVQTRIALSFINSHVYIAISINKNLFEPPSLFQSIDNYSQLATYHGYIQMCVGIVEELDLNTRIWTKE